MSCICSHAKVRHIDGQGRCTAMTVRARRCFCATYQSEISIDRRNGFLG